MPPRSASRGAAPQLFSVLECVLEPLYVFALAFFRIVTHSPETDHSGFIGVCEWERGAEYD